MGSLRAFFDESSVSSQDGPAFIFGGVVGTVRDIQDTTDLWQERLDEKPSIPNFHYKFGSHHTKIPSLASVLAESNLQGVLVSIPHAPFAARNKSAARGRFGSKAYDWAFIAAIMGILTWVDENFASDVEIDFIFDYRRDFDRCKREFFDRYRTEHRRRELWRHAGTCDHGDDEQIQALQMGDLLAGELFTCIRDGQISPPAMLRIAEAKPILLFRTTPPPVIHQSLVMENFGKFLFDSGRRKICEYPEEEIPVSVFSKELSILRAMEAWIQSQTEPGPGPQHEATTERCTIHAIQGRLEVHSDSIQRGLEAQNGGEAQG